MTQKIIITTLFISTLLISSVTFAKEQTATLSVPGMTCASCPYIVKSAISDVDGVKKVTTTFKDRTATVIFDDDVASIEIIQQATTDIGYPSSVLILSTGLLKKN
jgi:mercuric ion binding protein|tara:strand:+ start:117 stop:431 length:315 start_codon:yes stop_codon:yes gene_type:complete